jgi:NAD-dependent SIR2 family protein deacetylase
MNTKCIRCGQEVETTPRDGLTLTFKHEIGHVKVCDDCAEVVKERDYI